MSATGARAERRGGRARTWLRLGLACAVLALAAWFLRGIWVPPIVLHFVRTALAERWGTSLMVGQVGGAVERRWELAEVELARTDGTLSFSAGRLAVDFDLFGLLRGDLGALERIEASDFSLSIARPQAPLPTSAETWSWPSHLPALDLLRGRFALRLDAERSLALDDFTLQAGVDGQGVGLDAPRITFRHPNWGEREHALVLRGSFDRGEVRFDELSADGHVLAREARLDLTRVCEGRVAWNASLATQSGGLCANGRVDGEVVASEISLEDFDLEGLPVWLGRLTPRNLTGRMTLESDLRLALEDAAGFELAGRGTARDASFGALAFDEVQAEFVLTRQRLTLQRVQAIRGGNHGQALGVEIPLDAGDPLTLVRGVRGEVELELSDLGSLLQLAGDERFTREHLVQIQGSFGPDGFELASGRVDTVGGELELSRGRVRWGKDPASWLSGLELDLEAWADVRDLSDIGALVSDVPWCGSLRGSLSVQGDWRDFVGSVDLIGDDLQLGEVALGDLLLRGFVDARALHVTELVLRGPAADVEGRGDVLFRERAAEAVDLRFDVAAPSPWLPAALERGRFKGRVELEGPFATPRARFELQALGARIGGREVEHLDAQGSVDGERIEVAQLSARLAGVDVASGGVLTTTRGGLPIEAEVARLALTHEAHQLELQAPARFAWDAGSFECRGAELAGDAGRVRASFLQRGEELSLELDVAELATLRLFAPYLPAQWSIEGVHGTVSVRSGAAGLQADVDLTADDLRWRAEGASHRLRLRTSSSAGRLRVEELSLQRAEQRVLALTLDAPFELRTGSALSEGPLHAELELEEIDLSDLPLALLEAPWQLSGRATARLALEGSWAAPDLRCELGVESLTIHGKEAVGVETIGPGSLTLVGRWNDLLTLDTCSFELANAISARASGTLAVAADARRWTSFELEELARAPLALGLELEARDLRFLARLAPILTRTRGAFSADLALGGSAREPQWHGELVLREGELRLTTDMPPLSQVEARVVLDGGSARLESFQGELGASPISGTGTLDLSTTPMTIDLSVSGEELLFARAEGLSLRADAKLTVRGPLERLTIGGELHLRHGRWSRDFDLLSRISGQRRGRPQAGERGFELFAFESGLLADATFDLRVRSTEPFRVENNVVRTALRPELYLSGRGANPELVGTVFVDPGRVRLPGGSIELHGGTISLTRRTPIVPELELSGEARLAGYDVTLRVRGEYDHPEVILSSTPPLSSSDLLVLVLTGRPPADSLSQTSEQAAQSVVMYLGQDLLGRWLSDDTDEGGEPFIHRLEWQQGREVTESGGQTWQVTFRLSDDESRDNRSVYLRGEKDVYDRVNGGLRWVFRFP